MDVLEKEGSMFLQGVKFGKKIWRKIWVMVFKPSQVGIGRIEMYDVREGAGVSARLAILKKAEKRVIRLSECLSVTPALSESCPAGCTAFYLNTAQRIYTLAAPTHEEWVSALCSLAFQWADSGGEVRRMQGDGFGDDAPMTENDIYSSLGPGQFQVKVATSEASIRCSLFGSYLLSPEKENVCLLDMKTGHTVFSWPYRFLRRFGLVKEGITIEAGRRCQTGEGVFIFLSKKGPQIYQAIEEAIMHQSVQDLLSQATALPQENTVQLPVQTVSPASPKISSAISRRNLALPALPALPGPKPSARSPQPGCDQAVYAMVKPQPKPRNIPAPPPLPVPKLITETEANPNVMDFTDKEHDYESCEWNQKAQSRQDSSNSQLYSTVRPILHVRRKSDADTVQEQTKSSRESPEVSVNFKQILSDVLFKDKSRISPTPTPKPYEDKSDLLNEPDYYEIRK